jgi:hypothetical protein
LELKSPFYVELFDLNNFGRLVRALERSPLPSFSIKFKGENIFSVQTEFVNGIPLIYYVKVPEHQQDGSYSVNTSPSYHYLAYRCTTSFETVLPVETASNTLYVYSPIINIEKLPLIMEKSSRKSKKICYTKIKLRDLSSLVKVAAYKTIYDEPPLPIFVFKNKKTEKYSLGTSLNFMDNDNLTYYYYFDIDYEPGKFLKYSSQKSERPTFTNNIEEHGYIYLKVIKLIDEHPLVNYDD